MFKLFSLSFILGFFLISARQVSAQNVTDIKLDKFYTASFSEVLEDISHQFGVKFEYDSARCAEIEIADHPMQEPLTSFLD